MKTLNNILLASIIIAFAACKKSDDKSSTPSTSTSTTRSASFKIGNNSYTVTKPYLGIFVDNGIVKNTLTLTATDGSAITFQFSGSSPATYTLQSYSDAYYTNAAGKQYNSSSGQLITTAYTTDNNTYKTTGTFHFKAKTFVSPIDSIEITAGVITNASNEQ